MLRTLDSEMRFSCRKQLYHAWRNVLPRNYARNSLAGWIKYNEQHAITLQVRYEHAYNMAPLFNGKTLHHLHSWLSAAMATIHIAYIFTVSYDILLLNIPSYQKDSSMTPLRVVTGDVIPLKRMRNT